jgi:hypothetical protein
MVLGTTATLAVGTGSLSPASAADAPQIFDLSAQAIAVQSTVTDPGVPLGLPFSVGSYGASSELNSNGDSASDAGAPYSPLVASLPSTGNGVATSSFGYGLPVVPKFPGYVSAKDPLSPLVTQNAGGYELEARATPTESRGTVSLGGQAATSDENNAFAYADSVTGPDGVLSEGAAGVHGLTFKGIMDLANFSSYASLNRADDGTTVPVTRTDLGTISFAGLDSGLSAGGFSVFGSTPTPVSADGLGALNDALKPSGVKLTYLPEVYRYTDGSSSTGPNVDAKKIVSGVTSGALQIFASNTSDRGTTTETIIIGLVTVNATSANPSAGTSVASIPAPSVGAATPVSSSLPPVGAAGFGAPVSTTGVGAVAAPGSTSGRQLPTETFLPAASAWRDTQGTDDFGSSYAIIVLAAAVALLGGQVIRMLAVKLR